MQTNRRFNLDSVGKITDEDVFFVCGPDGGAHLADEADPSKSGGADTAMRAGKDNYVVSGFLNGPDVVVKVWVIDQVIFTPGWHTAEGRLAHTLGKSGNWKPDLGRRSDLTRQIQSYADAVKGILAPSRRPARTGSR